MSDATFLARGLREMQKSDLTGGTAVISTVAYPCTVGTFSKQDILIAGGVSPKMMGEVQILLSDLPDDLVLSLGLVIGVYPNSRPTRNCQLHSTQTAGNYVNILLWDVAESA